MHAAMAISPTPRQRAVPSPEAAGAHPAPASLDSPRALTRAIAQGNERAFEQFYNDSFETAYAIARRLTGRDESFCLDIVQDAMLKAARSMKTLDTPEALDAWYARVVHTVAIDRLRSERRRLDRERVNADDVTRRGLGELNDRIDWLRSELRKLGPDERALLTLRFGRSRTLGSTAAANDLTPAATHGKIRRTIARLRDAAQDLMP